MATYALDAFFNQTVPVLGFYWVPVLLATSFACVRQVALLNLLALVLATSVGLQLDLLRSSAYLLRLLAVTTISLVSLRLTQVRQRQERQLLATTSELQATLQAIPDQLCEVDRRGLVLKAQTHQEALVPQHIPCMVGRRIDQLLTPSAASEFLEALEEANREGFSFGRQICLPLASGEHWFELSVARKCPPRDPEPTFVVLVRDIQGRKQAESRLESLAYYDPLTDLPNRTHSNSLLEQALRTTHRQDQPLACLVLGLDRFKAINGSIGYETGDAVLREVAQRLKQCLRENDLVGRIGSDEFLVALPGADATEAAQLCARLQESLREPLPLSPHTIHLTSSTGIALFPVDGTDREVLMRKAATAMYQAKRMGGDRLHFFTASLEQQVVLQVRLAKALYGALDREEMRLLYQPQVDARTGEVLGAEALLRWNHHALGNVSPQEFIPIAESTGLILPIGQWVLHEAIQQLKRWQNTGLAIRTMAVNLSAVQFRQRNLADLVLGYLEETGLTGSRLELELTESVLIGDPEAAIAAMDRFSSAGIQLSIDDFGTGYSSLSYLKRLRVNKLKIDASFVRGLGSSQQDTSIVQAIINLAKDLQMETIAEGVEEESQLEALRQMGCDQIQGYYFAKPMPAEAFEAFARSQLPPSQGPGPESC